MKNNMYITFEGRANVKEINWLPCVQNNESAWYDINGETKHEYVNILIYTLIGYNEIIDDEHNSLNAVFEKMIEKMNNKDLIAPGGIHFIGETGTEIYPGCCCGLEEWRCIKSELMNGISPWMGHDPFVNYKEENGLCLITTKSENNTKPLNHYYKEIYYAKDEFLMLLSKLENDFNNFVYGSLKTYVKTLSEEYADDFCKAFYHCFRNN